MVWVGSELKDYLGPTPCHGQGHQGIVVPLKKYREEGDGFVACHGLTSVGSILPQQDGERTRRVKVRKLMI